MQNTVAQEINIKKNKADTTASLTDEKKKEITGVMKKPKHHGMKAGEKHTKMKQKGIAIEKNPKLEKKAKAKIETKTKQQQYEPNNTIEEIIKEEEKNPELAKANNELAAAFAKQENKNVKTSTNKKPEKKEKEEGKIKKFFQKTKDFVTFKRLRDRRSKRKK